ncbi:MAG: heavy-metal-associated domain-containing protein [Chitinophagaceae bacterium]
MKKLITVTMYLLITTFASAQIISAELTATGLTCSMCSKATYNQLKSIAEVERVEPDLNNTAFIIHFKNNTPVHIGNLKKKVEDAGFAVGELVVLFKFDNQVAENNTSFVLDKDTYTFMDTKPGTLRGEVKLKILDKGYVVDKEYKKYSNMAQRYPSYVTAAEHLYHVKTL